MQTQITHQCVIEEETEELGEKPLRRSPSGNRSTRQLVGIHGLARDPQSLIYPLFLSLPSFYSNKASRNRILSSSPDPATSSMLHPPTLASSNASQQHQKHSLHSENVWIVFGYNDFSLRMSSFLSKRWVCVLQKTYLGYFSLNDLLTLYG